MRVRHRDTRASKEGNSAQLREVLVIHSLHWSHWSGNIGNRSYKKDAQASAEQQQVFTVVHRIPCTSGTFETCIICCCMASNVECWGSVYLTLRPLRNCLKMLGNDTPSAMLLKTIPSPCHLLLDWRTRAPFGPVPNGSLLPHGVHIDAPARKMELHLPRHVQELGGASQCGCAKRAVVGTSHHPRDPGRV